MIRGERTSINSESSSASLLLSLSMVTSAPRARDFLLPWPALRFPFDLRGDVANFWIRGVERQSRKSSKLAVSSSLIMNVKFVVVLRMNSALKRPRLPSFAVGEAETGRILASALLRLNPAQLIMKFTDNIMSHVNCIYVHVNKTTLKYLY